MSGHLHGSQQHQRVHEARAVLAGVPRVDQQQDAGDQEDVDGEVERVVDRGEGELPALELEQGGEHLVEALVVVRDHVAGDEQELTDREQDPRQPLGGLANGDRDHATMIHNRSLPMWERGLKHHAVTLWRPDDRRSPCGSVD